MVKIKKFFQEITKIIEIQNQNIEKKIMFLVKKIPNLLKKTGIDKLFQFIWTITPVSLILTLAVALTVSGIIPEIFGIDLPSLFNLKFFIEEKVSLLPFVNNKIIFVVEYSARGLITALWFVFSLVETKERHLMVLRVFKQRIPFPFLYLSEGLKGTIIPWPIISGVQTSVVELTLGAVEGKENEYKSTHCQTLDEQEVVLEYAAQIRTFDPFKWKNVEKPAESIENKLLAQLRIITSLFKSKEINSLKGAIAGMLLGKEYLVWRNSDGDLLRNSGGYVIAIPADENKIRTILSTPTDQISRDCLQNYLSNLKKIAENKDPEEYVINNPNGIATTYSVETIPSITFDLEAVWKEARRVGAYIEPPSIRDITPPKKVREAADEKRVEELQGDARREENMRHSQIALEVLGLPLDTKVSELDKNTFEKWRDLKDDSLIQEEKITKVTVKSSGGNDSLGNDFADKILAAATVKKGA